MSDWVETKKRFQDWNLNGALIEEGFSSHGEKINKCEKSGCFVSCLPQLRKVKLEYEFSHEWGLFHPDNDWKVSISYTKTFSVNQHTDDWEIQSVKNIGVLFALSFKS